MKHPTKSAALVVGLVASLVFAVVGTANANTWAPFEDATITPGVQTVTDGGQCTANFVFTDGTNVFIGQAAHCSGLGGATNTDGCAQESLPIGTPVEIEGADHPGSIAYSSWITMNHVGEDDPNACAYNDFALVKIDSRDHDKVNPSLPVFGGPAGIDPNGCTNGETVYTYGNSSLRGGIDTLSPKTGTCVQTSGGGWTHTIYTATPGIPGDSGSPVLSSQGQGLGILVTVAIAPLAGSNGVTDLGHALAYANQEGEMGVSLANGTEAFTPSLLGLLAL